MADIKDRQDRQWFYSDTVKEHFLKPRNIATDDSMIEELQPNGVGEIGSPACGDVMKMWVRVDDKSRRIKGCLWRTFGCASAIASTSMLSVMVTENGGMTIEEAARITPKEILERLGGLPKVKIHCSVLGDQALQLAIKDYLNNSGKEMS